MTLAGARRTGLRGPGERSGDHAVAGARAHGESRMRWPCRCWWIWAWAELERSGVRTLLSSRAAFLQAEGSVHARRSCRGLRFARADSACLSAQCSVELLSEPLRWRLTVMATVAPAESFLVGTWLSLVEHSLGVRGVGSSNLPVPTNSNRSLTRLSLQARIPRAGGKSRKRSLCGESPASRNPKEAEARERLSDCLPG